MTDSTTKPEIEFWFEFGSTYSYLTMMRIEDEAQRYGVKVVWKPFLLGPIFQSLGTTPLKEKNAYVLKDMARQSEKYGLKWVEPSSLPRLGMLPIRIALLGAEEPWVGPFCREVMVLNYVQHADINQPDTLAPILTKLGLSPSDIFDQAKSDPIKTRLREQTEQARAKGIFGAPTFFVGREMFWGNDRLDDALKFASSQRV